MKTKKFKRVLTLVLALAMMLSLSMVSFANGSVTLYIDGDYAGSFAIGNDTTVYDIVAQQSTAVWSIDYNAVELYSPLCDDVVTNPLYGKYNKKVNYLESLVGNDTEPHEPAAGAVDVNGNYIPTQTVDPVLQEADEMLNDYGGLSRWDGNGYGYTADGHHGVYIGWDWEFTVNYTHPGKNITPTSPIYGSFFQYTMRESLLHESDRIDLSYEYYFFVFDLA